VPTYAAIKLNRETIGSAVSSALDGNGGRERLVWALFNYPYQPGVDHYFVGGNYLKQQGALDYSRQILTRAELDRLFTYQKQEKKNGRRDPELNWFPVTLREPSQEDAAGLCSTCC
jgi:hypothetical protein